MLGCYSFPMHVLVHYDDIDPGVEIRSVRDALADSHEVTYAPGCPVLGGTDEQIAEAVAAAAGADVCVAVLGDQSGLFGNGTSGEGCDVADLRLPGRQEELLEALLATGTPVVAVLLVVRPPGWRDSSVGSSPARRARRRSPTCSAGGSTRRGGCR
jgi:beta-glucosidase